ncbi:MAG: pyrroline-5-carboxylate reductase [Oscillospiraceae bacterium]|nr:pyrroline-5-carboxylate reductase [Oscillospiraceae bacterium]
MDKNMKIAFIGAGHLAGAIVGALLGLGVDDQNITVFDKIENQYAKFEKFNLKKARSIEEALIGGEMIFLAVRPGDFSGLLPAIKNTGINFAKKIFVSTAVGITTEHIEEKIGKGISVVRTMPNTPVSIARGMTALCKNQSIPNKDFDAVCAIFSALGEIIVLPEEKMNKIVSVNGSSPAYAYLFAEAMVKGSIEQGFGEEEIYPAILQSLIGAFEMLKTSKKTPAELISAVAVPGGTTEKALESFYADDLEGTVKRAMLACTKRADELTSAYCKK